MDKEFLEKSMSILSTVAISAWKWKSDENIPFAIAKTGEDNS